jgi:cysteinyl-tRNA synthetase
MLKSHYRQPMDWTVASLEEATRSLERWYKAIDSVLDRPSVDDVADDVVLEALQDDLNTALAVARLHEICDDIRGPTSGWPNVQLQRRLKASGQLLGLFGGSAAAFLGRKVRPQVIHRDEVEHSIAARAAARKSKNFAEADRIRAELDAMGIALKDSKDPKTGEMVTTWEVKR